MTVGAPPRPLVVDAPPVDPARSVRVHRVLMTSVLIAIGLGVGALAAAPGGRSTVSASTLGPIGIGTVRLGLTKPKAVPD